MSTEDLSKWLCNIKLGGTMYYCRQSVGSDFCLQVKDWGSEIGLGQRPHRAFPNESFSPLPGIRPPAEGGRDESLGEPGAEQRTASVRGTRICREGEENSVVLCVVHHYKSSTTLCVYVMFLEWMENQDDHIQYLQA